MTRYVDLYLTGEEIITPREYLRRRGQGDSSVKNAEFVPPRLGEPHFGKFRIKHAEPFYGIKRGQ